MTLKAVIVQRLEGRAELRRGEQSAIARELGCSRVWVGMVARELGIPLAERRACERCGKITKLSQEVGLCGTCLRRTKVATLTCANCGKRFERRRHEYERFLKRSVTQGRRGPVCGRDCGVGYETTCAWCGRLTTRPYRKDKRLGFCAASRGCLSQAMRALPVVYWRYLTPDLLPMKDHRAEIGRLRESQRIQTR